MYVYLDETEFGEGEFSGYGSLITEERIGQEVIDEALENLRADEDRFLKGQKTMDDRTLERGYFHAADDSKNAHSHLCNAINKHVTGNFKSHIFETSKHSFSGTDEIYDLASKLSVVSLFSKTRELTFIFEGRDGLSVQGLVERWWPDLWKGLSQNCFKAPFIVKYYPNVKFETSNKKEPGSQVVDFILWSSQRAIYAKDSKWYDRLNGWAKSSMTTVDGGWEGHSITKMIPEDLEQKRYDIEDSLNQTPLLGQDHDIHTILVNVQKVINHSSRHKDQHTNHFETDIKFVTKHRAAQRDPDFIIRMADCFIKLFDNIHLITKETPTSEKAFWLVARKCMALTLRDDIEAKIHTIRLSDIRNDLIRQQPELFNYGLDG